MTTTRRIERDGLDEAGQHVLVIGGDSFGLAVAESLTESARSVTYVSADPPPTVADGVTALHRRIRDAGDVRALAPDVSDVDLVVAVGSDKRALLTGILVRQELDPSVVVAGVSDPANEAAFEGAGVDCIDLPRLLADGIRDRYE